MQFAVHRGSASLYIGDVKEMVVRPARKSDLQRLAHGGMCPVAPSNVGSLTRFRCSIRLFQAGENTTSRSLEAQELRQVLDVDATLGQAIGQQTFVFVLGKDQRVWKWADARAHVAEDCMCRLVAGHPEIHGYGLPPTLDDRVSE